MFNDYSKLSKVLQNMGIEGVVSCARSLRYEDAIVVVVDTFELPKTRRLMWDLGLSEHNNIYANAVVEGKTLFEINGWAFIIPVYVAREILAMDWPTDDRELPEAEFEAFWNARENTARARQGTTTLTRIRNGFYIWVHPDGTLYEFEYVRKVEGFPVNEWRWGPEKDYAADQAATLREIREWIAQEVEAYARPVVTEEPPQHIVESVERIGMSTQVTVGDMIEHEKAVSEVLQSLDRLSNRVDYMRSLVQDYLKSGFMNHNDWRRASQIPSEEIGKWARILDVDVESVSALVRRVGR